MNSCGVVIAGFATVWETGELPAAHVPSVGDTEYVTTPAPVSAWAGMACTSWSSLTWTVCAA